MLARIEKVDNVFVCVELSPWLHMGNQPCYSKKVNLTIWEKADAHVVSITMEREILTVSGSTSRLNEVRSVYARRCYVRL